VPIKFLYLLHFLAHSCYKAARAIVMVKRSLSFINCFFSHSSELISVLFILPDSPT